jgi:hypothetical protein
MSSVNSFIIPVISKLFLRRVRSTLVDLAYNLSPPFNWDTTGMSDEEMKRFPEELGKMGSVFNFIACCGHHGHERWRHRRGVRHRVAAGRDSI